MEQLVLAKEVAEKAMKADDTSRRNNSNAQPANRAKAAQEKVKGLQKQLDVEGLTEEKQKTLVEQLVLAKEDAEKERFKFQMPSSAVSQMRLVLDVYDEDNFTKDDYLGSTILVSAPF